MSLTFDDRASLYLVQYVVRQHAEDNRNDHPLAIAVILLQVYVDDIMTSLSTNDKRLKLETSLGSHLARQASKCGLGVVTGQNYIA